jgi:hypothetical protein
MNKIWIEQAKARHGVLYVTCSYCGLMRPATGLWNSPGLVYRLLMAIHVVGDVIKGR